MSGLLANPSDVSVLWLKDGRPHAVKVGTLKVDHGVATWIRADSAYNTCNTVSEGKNGRFFKLLKTGRKVR